MKIFRNADYSRIFRSGKNFPNQILVRKKIGQRLINYTLVVVGCCMFRKILALNDIDTQNTQKIFIASKYCRTILLIRSVIIIMHQNHVIFKHWRRIRHRDHFDRRLLLQLIFKYRCLVFMLSRYFHFYYISFNTNIFMSNIINLLNYYYWADNQCHWNRQLRDIQSRNLHFCFWMKPAGF